MTRDDGSPKDHAPEADRNEIPEDLEMPSSPRITLDWTPRGRRSQLATFGHIVTLVFMVLALVAIFMFKDRCGEMASETLFIMSGGATDAGEGGAQNQLPSGSIRLEDHEKPPSPAPATAPGTAQGASSDEEQDTKARELDKP